MTEASRRAAEKIVGKWWNPQFHPKLVGSIADAIDTAIARAVAESWAPTCMRTGKKAVQGVCPEHGGDGCLMASALVEAQARAVAERDSEIMRLHAEHDNYVLAEDERVARAVAAKEIEAVQLTWDQARAERAIIAYNRGQLPDGDVKTLLDGIQARAVEVERAECIDIALAYARDCGCAHAIAAALRAPGKGPFEKSVDTSKVGPPPSWVNRAPGRAT